MPMIWSILTEKEREPNMLRFSRTESFRTRPYPKRNYTAPIRFKTELKTKYMKETG